MTLLPGFATGHERNTVAETPGFAKMAQVYGAYTGAFLLLVGGVVAVLRTARVSAETGAEPNGLEGGVPSMPALLLASGE